MLGVLGVHPSLVGRARHRPSSFVFRADSCKLVVDPLFSVCSALSAANQIRANQCESASLFQLLTSPSLCFHPPLFGRALRPLVVPRPSSLDSSSPCALPTPCSPDTLPPDPLVSRFPVLLIHRPSSVVHPPSSIVFRRPPAVCICQAKNPKSQVCLF